MRLPSALNGVTGLRPTIGRVSNAGVVPLARTTAYDTRLVTSVSTPTAAVLAVEVPTTVLRGDPTMPLLVAATERLAAEIPGAELVVVPESHDHGVDPAGTVREVRARIG